MSLIDEFIVEEVWRDRYSRESQLHKNLLKIVTPCHGIGLRSRKDLDAFVNLRLTQPTERLGLCVIELAKTDNTFVWMQKELNAEKHKLSPTALGTQLKMFEDQTMLVVLPTMQYTYYYDQDMIDDILTSLETPTFLKDFVRQLKAKAKKIGNTKSEEFQDWKKQFFEEKWLELNADPKLLDQLITENYNGQNTSNATILVPSTPPLVTQAMYYIAIKIIEETTKLAPNSTAIYFHLPFSILRDTEFRKKILDYCEKAKNRIIILKIRDIDQLVDPDKEEERISFSEIQDRLCIIRKNDSKCTILLDGSKLTIPSLARGFDIVTNPFSGRLQTKRRKRKQGVPDTDPKGYSQYLIRGKLIFYQYKKMLEYTENNLKLTNGEHGLNCPLPCCIGVKSLKDITKEFWNFSIARPHFALNMNEIAKRIAKLMYDKQIQNANDIILESELCVLKHLIPDV